ncbi:hypothetical protein [Klebsiella aerogenes]|uniref:hypothetical protein n=1 Tax=Klebsiella aerogenes TaxID=548 RepID=UPI00254E97B4|nr:hypothetical protein [Klebsiella aerogenes]EKZ5287320.1 hypothetical protein [Klebsiella aerogenes]MDK7101000.1 hypothetical protein [Klebsiella aerogenes]MDK7850933.1 hypothetical protein [Klebsiella aerogenes]
MQKIFSAKASILFVIVFGVVLLALLVSSEMVSIDFSKHGFLNFSCKAYGNKYINGYNLQYVETYRFYKTKDGNFAVSGKVFEGDNFIGIIGLKTSFSYVYSNGMVTLRTNNAIVQVDNSINTDILLDIIPKSVLNKNNIQLIALFKLGGGYRIDYNTYPTAYCY